MDEKTCRVCGQTKPVSQFSRDRSKTGGYARECKACESERHRAYYAEHAERIRRRVGDYREANPEKVSKVKRDWYERNREHVSEKVRSYREAHPEWNREQHHAWYVENLERIKPQRQEYAAAHRDELIAKARERYRRDDGPHLAAFARKRAASPDIPIERFSRREIWERDHGVCGICGQPVIYEKSTVDHIIPMRRGGSHTRANVQIAHRGCNQRKKDKLPDELTPPLTLPG